MLIYKTSNEVYHHGILGMKWGVRRYQNKDGTLTNAGKKRQAKLMGEYQQLTGKNLKYASMAKARKDKAVASKKKSDNELSDDELKSRINRLQLEKNYFELQKQVSQLNPPHVSAGKKFLSAAKDVAGTEIKEAAKDAATKYAKKMLSKALGIDEQTTEDVGKALEKEAKYWENMKKVPGGKYNFDTAEASVLEKRGKKSKTEVEAEKSESKLKELKTAKRLESNKQEIEKLEKELDELRKNNKK